MNLFNIHNNTVYIKHLASPMFPSHGFYTVSGVGFKCLLHEFFILDLPGHVMVKFVKHVINFVLVQYNIGEFEDGPKFRHGQVAVVGFVQLAECTSQILPVSAQLKNKSRWHCVTLILVLCRNFLTTSHTV